MCFNVMPELSCAHHDCVIIFSVVEKNFLDSVRISDTKYTRNYCFIILYLCMTSFSTTKAPLTSESVVETERMRGFPYSRIDSVGKCSR
jgi:hypothetical protein